MIEGLNRPPETLVSFQANGKAITMGEPFPCSIWDIGRRQRNIAMAKVATLAGFCADDLT
jgi:hypothetical protein